MNSSERALYQFISQFQNENFLSSKGTLSGIQIEIENMPASELARIYVLTAYLISSLKALQDHHWLQTHHQSAYQAEFHHFLKVALHRELQPISFLEPLFDGIESGDIRRWSAFVKSIHQALIENLQNLENGPYREAVRVAMQEMDFLTGFERNLEYARHQAEENLELRLSRASPIERQWPHARPRPEEGLLPNGLHRSFDGMDEILGIDYKRDLGMKVDLQNSERLYEGAGMGVQSSYYTILTALQQSRPSPGSRFIDLGSGYGRVGIVVGLLRPDLEVLGYEYVGHRVEVSQTAADRSGVSQQVHFHEQDLSRTDFQIPDAEVYYMYDPFSEETYRHVWNQLQEIGKRKSIVIATKGNAGAWFTQAVSGKGWAGPEIHDTGNVHLFRSKAL